MKQIYVQAQADHIESLVKGAPLMAIEELVAKMESGEMNLDDMIKSFEEGRRLVTECQKDLDSIRQRIEKVTKDGQVVPLEV